MEAADFRRRKHPQPLYMDNTWIYTTLSRHLILDSVWSGTGAPHVMCFGVKTIQKQVPNKFVVKS